MFVEEGDISAKMETHTWYKEFVKEQDKIYVNVNDPRIDPMGTCFAERFEFRKHNTLREFKEKVGAKFGLKLHEFSVKRYMVSREMKNLEQTLISYGIINNCNIKIEIGKAHTEGVFELNILRINLN